MTREETIKLLALIKVAYPTAYKDMDTATKLATVNMWQTSFSAAPYPIMEMAFNNFRMVSKYPPTVAEMCDELKHLHWQAVEDSLRAMTFGGREDLLACEWVMKHTEAYKSAGHLKVPVYSSVKQLEGNPIAGALERGKDENDGEDL